jgi:glycosyltransferase involved in cell wall biosynthesis
MNSSENPLITVLMPCYNAMPFLVEALESIVNQTYSNLEIICINDCSTDETGEVLDRYATGDARFRIIHNETNIKLIRSLNKGIDLARGEYIARMDADDIAALDRIEIELNYMKSNPTIDIISCGLWVISESGKIMTKIIPRQNTALACFFASFFYVPIGHPELLVKTKVLKENNFMDEEVALHTEDYELWSRLLRKGYILQNMSELLHYFRINSQSVSRKYTDIQDSNFVECAKRHYFEYSGKIYSSEVVKVLVNRIDKSLLFSDLKFALKEMKIFKTYFILNEQKRLKKVDENEINVVYFTQLFDICFQVIKKASVKSKLLCFGYLFLNMHMVFHGGVFRYIKNKVI